MTPDERLTAEIELWQVRAKSPLFPASDISQLIDTLRDHPDRAMLEQSIREATDNRLIASLAHNALVSPNREWARDTIDRLDSQHAYVAQMLNNMRVRKAIEIDLEGQRERARLAADIGAFVEQRRAAGQASKRRKWADVLGAHISSWDELPESYSPLEIFDGSIPLQFYRDVDDHGRQVVRCVDGDNDKLVGSLARTTFEKRYLKK